MKARRLKQKYISIARKLCEMLEAGDRAKETAAYARLFKRFERAGAALDKATADDVARLLRESGVK